MTTIQKQPSLLIFGGTFDPPHNGHLNIALAVQTHFHFDSFMFLPCQTPVLKSAAHAKAEQRVEMLRLLIKANPVFSLNETEVRRESPSYMVETLKTLRQQWGEEVSITLLLGWDAFVELPRWHNWNMLLQLAHILVVRRPHQSLGNSETPELSDDNSAKLALSKLMKSIASVNTLQSLKTHQNRQVLEQYIQSSITTQTSTLLNSPCGKVYFFNAGDYPISSTIVRSHLQTGQDVGHLLPTEVYAYIKHHRLYHD